MRETGEVPEEPSDGGDEKRGESSPESQAFVDDLRKAREDAEQAPDPEPPTDWRAGEVVDITDGQVDLSKEDREAIRDYTGDGYLELNPVLRNPPPPEGIARRAEAVSAALSKLPVHRGTVYRGTNLGEGDLARYEPGITLQEDAFTSASVDKPFPGNTQYFIESYTGREVSGLAEYGPEHEVLFDKGTRFTIIGHDVEGDVHRIYMKEVV